MKLKDLVEAASDDAKKFEEWLHEMNVMFRTESNKKGSAKPWKYSKGVVKLIASQPYNIIFNEFDNKSDEFAPYATKTLKLEKPPVPVTWDGFNYARLNGVLIETFDVVPDVRTIAIAATNKCPCDIKTFNGIEKLSKLKSLTINFANTKSEGLNFLRLLKSQSIQEVNFWDSAPYNNSTKEAKDYKELAEILNKHLKSDRSLIDCQNELIDADMDEFAIL